MKDVREKSFFDDDENVKAMRETAEEIGLTQLLRDMRDSDNVMSMDDINRLLQALELLGE